MGLWGYTRRDDFGRDRFHAGVDINAHSGSRVFSAEGGRISDIGYRGAAGRRLQITTDSGAVLTYAHMGSFSEGLSLGAVVGEGEIVGTVGTTGNARNLGPDDQHLHFAVTIDGVSVDPVNWLNDPLAPEPRISTPLEFDPDEGQVIRSCGIGTGAFL